MGRFKKFLTVDILLVVVFFVSLILWVRMDGKAFVERRASLMLGRPVSVERVRIVFPGILRLDDLNVEGLLWADAVEVRGNPLSFWGREFHLGQVSLEKPILTLHRTKDQQIVWGPHALENAAGAAVATPPGHHIQPVIDVLMVTNGQVFFPSHAGDDEALEFSLSRVEMTARNVPLSGQAADVGFNVLGRVEGTGIPLAQDSVKGSGWINWPQRNMDATFDVVNQQGKIDIELNLNAKNNDMMVRGRVKTRRMNLKSGEPSERSMEHLLLDAIQSAGLEVNLEFSLQTKMDRWELKNIDFSGNLNASDEAKTPAEKMEDLKNIGEQFKAVGEQIYDQYKKP